MIVGVVVLAFFAGFGMGMIYGYLRLWRHVDRPRLGPPSYEERVLHSWRCQEEAMIRAARELLPQGPELEEAPDRRLTAAAAPALRALPRGLRRPPPVSAQLLDRAATRGTGQGGRLHRWSLGAQRNRVASTGDVVTDEQIRLYAIARTVIPGHVRIRTIAEPAGMLNTLYTLELTPPEGKQRWFGVHSKDIRRVDDDRLAIEIRAAIGG